MAYLLILPIGLYALLTAIVLAQTPRTLSHIALVAHLGCVILATANFMILGTTTSQQTAKYAAYILTICLTGSYTVFIPLTIIGLYWTTGLKRYWPPLAGLLLIGLLVQFGLSQLAYHNNRPIVYQLDDHIWVYQMLYRHGITVDWAIFAALSSHALIALSIGWALYQQRLAFWPGAAVMIGVFTVSMIHLNLAPWAGDHWVNLIAALHPLLPAAMLTIMVIRAGQSPSLETVITETLQTQGAYLIVLDAQNRVLWHNLHAAPWLNIAADTGPPSAAANLTTLLADFPALSAIMSLLTHERDTQTCEIDYAGKTFVLQLARQSIPPTPRHRARTQIVIQDVTTERMRRSLSERTHELTTLSLISADIAAALDVEQVVARTLTAIRQITQLDSLIVYLNTPENPRHIQIVAQEGLIPPNTPTGLLLDDLPDFHLIRQVMQQRQVQITTPDSAPPYLAGRIAAFGAQAGMFVPLVTRQQSIGILFATKQTASTFSPLEITLIESVARQMSVAVDNARLHTREREQRHLAEVLQQVAATLNYPTLAAALDQILTLLREVLAYERATVMLKAEPGLLRLAGYAGIPDPDHAALSKTRVRIADYPYLKRLFDERAPQLVADTATDDLWDPGEFGAPAWMGVPLIGHDELLGCLSISHTTPGYFTPADVHTVMTFAAQVAIVAENAQLLTIEQQNRAHAELMQQASYALVSSPDLAAALQTVMTELANLIPYDQIHIGLLDEQAHTWAYHAAQPPLDPIRENSLNQQPPVTAYPLIGALIETKQPILIPETRHNDRWRPSERGTEVRCWLGMPLVVRDRVIGVINLDSFTPYAFGDQNIHTLQVFANQSAAALENFHLLRETRRQNRALSALNTVLAASNEALTHENMLSAMLARVLEALDLPAGLIHHYRPSTQELHLRAAHGLPDEALDQLRTVPLTMLYADDAPPRITLFPHELPPLALSNGTTLTFTSAPLIAHGIEIGLLSIIPPDAAPISADLCDLLTRIGQQLGVVMDNATLFENTTRRIMLSTDLGRLSLALSTQLERDALLHLICRESISIFDVQGAYIWLVESDTLVGAVAYGPGADSFPGHRVDRLASELVINYVLDEWRPHYINHVAHTPVLPADFLALSGALSVLAVPLLRGDVPLGTLLLTNTEDPTAFAGWLLEQIGLLGVQAALALQNASLFDTVRRRLDQLRLVNETGRYTTAILSPQELIEGIAQKLSNALHYDSVGLLQLGELPFAHQSVYYQGRLQSIADIPGLAPILAEQAEQSIQEADPILSHLTIYQPSHALMIPLIVADEVIGVLFVARHLPQQITAEDLDVLEPLATQLAISVSNARLFEKVRQNAIELEARVAQRTREIRQQQQRTEAILRSVADAVIVFDLQGQVIMTNPSARHLFDEHDLDMDLGKHVGELVDRALVAQANQHNATDIIELGSTILQANAARVREGDRALGSVVILRDISQLKHLDRMKDQFVSNVSHELRTPLANLKLYLSLVEKGRADRRAGYLEVMDREIQRLTRLIDDLLQISRLQSEGRDERPQIRQEIRLHDLIDIVIQQNLARAEATHKEVRCQHTTGPLPPVTGDPDQLHRAFTNLVSNAINYTPEGGVIEVTTRVTQTNPEWVIIEVTDTGIGIPAVDLPNIFDRFIRGSNVQSHIPGTGLGLAIIKEIVELHHGKIEVESEENQGSTFRIWLPVMRPRNED